MSSKEILQFVNLKSTNKSPERGIICMYTVYKFWAEFIEKLCKHSPAEHTKWTVSLSGCLGLWLSQM